jgi:nicotinamidase-related amidase
MEGDEILLAGEAGSHCLANTVSDMADSFGDDSFISKCVLLTDGTSPVPGFDQLQTDFVAKMTKRGMKTITTVDYLK